MQDPFGFLVRDPLGNLDATVSSRRRSCDNAVSTDGSVVATADAVLDESTADAVLVTSEAGRDDIDHGGGVLAFFLGGGELSKLAWGFMATAC